MTTLTQATKNYLDLRAKKEALEAELAQAEADMKASFAQAGINYNVVDGTKVAIVRGERPTYDANKLVELVSARIYKAVTKPTVDTKKFRSALELGQITPEVAEAVTKVTAYDQVRVTELAESKTETTDTENVVSF